ncbi:MAG: WYL domain-containing protein, partial [Prevotella sp.]|nr:WYL domain-containing protein [Prevotella sp.]
KEFSAAEYFKDCFGVYREESIPVQKVVIRAFGLQRYYMRDLPWHNSQKEKFWGEEYADYEFTLRPTNDFIRFIMRYGTQVKVISPVDLARKVRAQLLEAIDMYSDLEE